MAKFAGTGGKLMVGTSTAAEIKSWSIDGGADMLDVTNFGSGGWKENIAGLREWSASVEGNWDMTDTNGQKALQDAWLNGSSVAVKFYVDGTKNYSGSAYISGLSPEVAVDDAATVSIDLQGTGALSYTAT